MERRGVRGAAVAGVALCTVMALMIAHVTLCGALSTCRGPQPLEDPQCGDTPPSASSEVARIPLAVRPLSALASLDLWLYCV